MERNTVALTGLLGNLITVDHIKEDWRDQLDRLTNKCGYTTEAAVHICAIAEHLDAIRWSEKPEYLEEIFELGLPFSLACDLTDVVNRFYNK